MDGLIFNEHPYVLDWYLPCERILYWNKFGTPDTVLLKYHEWDDVFALWWFDSEKATALKQAKRDGSSLSVPPVDVRPWSDANQVVTAER